MKKLILILLFAAGCATGQEITVEDLTTTDDATIGDDLSVTGISTLTGGLQSPGVASLTGTSPLILGSNGADTTITWQSTTIGTLVYSGSGTNEFTFNRPVNFSGGLTQLDFGIDSGRGPSFVFGDDTDADWTLWRIDLGSEQHTFYWDDMNDKWRADRGFYLPDLTISSNPLTISQATGIDFSNSSGNLDIIQLGHAGTPELDFVDSLQDFFRFRNSDGYLFSTGDNGDITEVLDTNVVQYVASFTTQSGAAREGGIAVNTYTNNDDSGNKLFFFRADGSASSPALVDDDDYLGGITFAGYDGADMHTGAYIRAEIDGTPASNDIPGTLIFGTADNATTTDIARFTPAGNFEIISGQSITFADSSLDSVLTLSEGSDGGDIQILNDDATPFIRAQLGVDGNDRGYLDIYGDTGEREAELNSRADGGELILYDDTAFAPEPRVEAYVDGSSNGYVGLRDSTNAEMIALDITNGLVIGDGTDEDLTILTIDQGTGADPTIAWDDTNDRIVIDEMVEIDTADGGIALTVEPSGAGVGEFSVDSLARFYQGSPLIAITGAAGTVTTFSASANVMELSSTNAQTIATVSGASVNGMRVTMIFRDSNITITDDNSHAADTVDLSAAFVSADDTVLEIISDGTSWYEVSRSVN